MQPHYAAILNQSGSLCKLHRMRPSLKNSWGLADVVQAVEITWDFVAYADPRHLSKGLDE